MKNISLSKILDAYSFWRFLSGSKDQLSMISYFKVFCISFIIPFFVITGSYLDKTLFLPGNGKGFLQHYAVWIFFISTPFLIVLTLLALVKFITILKNVEDHISIDEIPRSLKVIIYKHVRSLSLRAKCKNFLFLLKIIGFFFSIINVIQTINPKDTYGNDVFDSYPYICGYISNKIYLSLLFTLIYPTILYFVFHITFSMSIILKELYYKKILFVDFFNEDKCGGVSDFGLVNTIIMLVYLTFFIIILGLHYTHTNKYLTLISPTIMILGLMLLHSFFSTFYIHKFLKQEKQLFIKRINNKLNSMTKKLDIFPSNLLNLRNHVISMRTYPYTRVSSFFKNLTIIPPAITALLQLILFIFYKKGF